MTRIFFAAVAFLAIAWPARAADICQIVSSDGDLRHLEAAKSGGDVAITPQASFPDDVKPFVIKTDPTFQDQVIELYPLGKDGAGLALHYEGTLPTEYFVAFDRLGDREKGKLISVALPNLNPEADDYFEARVATIGGTPVLFSTREAEGKKRTRLAPWTGHGFGPVCEAHQ
ncbi:MAG TPA: hypothetical protein VN723_08015 [Rhizomicrobium sp.]|jgi:hypothetical protein|nr:hypothetical protein [Rhizomicrobium sp.]